MPNPDEFFGTRTNNNNARTAVARRRRKGFCTISLIEFDVRWQKIRH